MKRLFRVAIVMVVCSVCAAASVHGGVGFRVGGAFSYISYGQYNNMVDYFNDEILSEPSASGKLDNLHWVPELSGEFLYSLAPMVQVGIGAGLIWGTSRFSVEPLDYVSEHTVRAYPVTATVYVETPVPYAAVKPYVFAGGGAYYSKVGFTVSSAIDSLNMESDLSAWGFGLHGGAGVEYSIAPKVSLVFEAKGRWAKIQGLEGTRTIALGPSEDAYLAYIEESDRVNYGPMSTDDSGTYGEGTVDLSGFAFSLGIKVAF